LATVATVVAAIRPSPMPIRVCTPAMVAETAPSDSWVVPPIQYSRTKPWDAATTLTTEAMKAVVATPDAVLGRIRSRPAIST
jgi:hypothetical protein